MPNSTTQTSVIDRGLQLLGYAAITSAQQVGSRGAKAMQRAYSSVLQSELQKNYWHFSIKRASIAASATPPVHTKGFAYPLPGDYLMVAPDDDDGSDFMHRKDWVLEQGHIITDDSSPLYIRYVSNDIIESQFDAIFAEAMSAALAMACCEELTNSQSKFDRVAALYEMQINNAKQRGAILIRKARLPISPWISKRG